MKRLGSAALIAATLLGASAWPVQAHDPKPDLTWGEAIRAFVDAVNQACIYSMVTGTPLDALPPGVEDDLVPADAKDHAASVAPKDHPLWVSKVYGNHLSVFIGKDGACTVVADQLPVQRTLDIEARIIRELGKTAYQERPFKPGYNPIGYEFVRKLNDGSELKVHMEGAEPGLLFHASRYSLIVVDVSRKPQAVEKGGGHSAIPPSPPPN